MANLVHRCQFLVQISNLLLQGKPLLVRLLNLLLLRFLHYAACIKLLLLTLDHFFEVLAEFL